MGLLRAALSTVAAIVMLVVIAAAAAALLYIWLTGLLASLHLPWQVSTRVVILSANVTSSSSLGQGGGPATIVVVRVYNPSTSVSTAISLLELNAMNGTTLCSITRLATTSPFASANLTEVPIGSGEAVTVGGVCQGLELAPSTQVEVVVVTQSGFEASASVTVSG
ncbi:MAG: hypothetical protein ACP5FT_01900 [Acidilobus sp.]